MNMRDGFMVTKWVSCKYTRNHKSANIGANENDLHRF